MVLEWHDPKPLSRAWCVWEIASTVNTKSNFQVLMSPKNQASFFKALLSEFDSIVFKTCNVDLAKAEAFKASDRDSIFKAVEATTGFQEINKQVIGVMREWMAQRGREALAQLPENDEFARLALKMSLARLLHNQGMFREAEPLFRETLEAHRRILGDSHPGTLNSMNNLALLLKDQGKFDEAEPLLRDALRVSRLTLGYVHPDTLAGIRVDRGQRRLGPHITQEE